MKLNELLTGGGGLLFVLLTVIQIAPIEVKPWSAIAKAFGSAVNAEVLKELEAVKEGQKEAKEKLEAHIEMDDERTTDGHRTKILHFNNELLRNIDHTEEEFTEILADIDEYERYCKDHQNYKNNRAVHAIGNIKRVYDERLEKRDFLQ